MRESASGMFVIGLLLVAATAGAAGPRLTVGPVRGDTRSVIPTQLAELLCASYDCVLWKEVSTRREPDLAKARTLDVRGILSGVVRATATGQKVTLSLLTTSPRPARTWDFPLTVSGRLTATATRQLELDLPALLRPPPPAAPPPPVRAPEPVATAALAPPPAAATRPPPAAVPAPAERRWLAGVEVGLFADQRRLSYGGLSASTGTLLGFDAAAMVGASVSVEVFPLAHGASAALGGAGLRVGLATSIGLKTQDPAGDELPTRFSRVEIGARWRSPPLTALRLVLVPDVAWVSHKLIVTPAIPGLPNSDLSGVRVGLSAEARVASRVTILAGVGWVDWLTARELIQGEPAFFPGSGASGLEAEVGAGVAVGGPISLRLLGQYASTRYRLTPDPTGTYAATSAEDRLLGLCASVRGEF